MEGLDPLSTTSKWPAARGFLLSVVLPNIIGLAVARGIGVPRAWVDLDYVLVWAIRPALATYATLIGCALVADLFIAVIPLFGLQPVDAELSFLTAPVLGVFAAIVLVAALAVIARQALRARQQRPRSMAIRLGLVVVLLAADVANGSSGLALSMMRLPANIATSASAQMFRAAWVAVSHPRVEGVTAAQSAVQTELLPELAVPGTVPDVLLVLDESLGSFADAAGDSLLASAWRMGLGDQAAETRVGVVPTHGATTEGEVRELCSVHGNYRTALTDDLACLPRQLDQQGYATLAVHGFRGFGFHRDVWYPKLGFQRVVFSPDLAAAGIGGTCGVLLRGACDHEIARWVAERFDTSAARRPTFVYWMTLNTHLPLDPKLPAWPSARCAGIAALASGTLCLYARQHASLLESLAHALERPRCRPLVVLVAGDHPPPFPRPALRSAFKPASVFFIRTRLSATTRCG
jgi:phosphoglycerol transferase MdoB-like AlkP superfamily enzyme